MGDLTIVDNGPKPEHTLLVPEGTILDVHGDIFNDGLINVVGTTDLSTRIRADGSDLNITGSGSIRLGVDFHTDVLTSVGDHVITNGAGHRIEGEGLLGEDTARLVNLGTIDADVNGRTLTDGCPV